MKQFALLILLLNSQIGSSQSFRDPEGLLDQVEARNREINSIYFYSSYVNINPGLDDSLYHSQARVWVQVQESDSALGAYVHLKGTDKHGNYEYFYNGHEASEVRGSEINIFYPYEYELTDNNPGFARTALLPFTELVYAHRIKSILLEGNPALKVQENAKTHEIVLTLEYPRKSDVAVTRTLTFDSRSLRPKRYLYHMLWQNMHYQMKYRFDSVRLNFDDDEMVFDPPTSVHGYVINYIHNERQLTKEAAPGGVPGLIGKQAAAFDGIDINNVSVGLDQLKGKLVLLDFWESWCGYCIQSIPKLKSLSSELDKDLEVVGIYSENRNGIMKIITRNEIEYRNLLVKPAVLKDYNVSARPTYILIDREGKVVAESLGDLDLIKVAIKKLR